MHARRSPAHSAAAAAAPVRALRPVVRHSPVASSSSSSPSPSPSNLARQDAHADSGSDLNDDAENDDAADEGAVSEDDDDAVVDDADVIDASGHVVGDAAEMLDDEPIPRPAARKHGFTDASSALTSSGGNVSRAATYSTTAASSAAAAAAAASSSGSGELLSSASQDHLGADSAEGSGSSRKIYLCPSLYGRPATVYFDYPLQFGIRRNQEKILCDKPCTLRFKHADDACIYNSITGTLKRAGFVEQLATSGRERFAWNLRWGKHMMPEAFKDLKSYQKINHFPGTGGIGRKDRLARNLAKSRRLWGGAEINFLPETYLLPGDRSLWELRFAGEPPGTLWISKPNSSSCGRGIKLVSKISDIPAKRSCIVSRYIANPLLVRGHKFDLRIYVLVTSFNPLRIYLYQNGLARFCTSAYDLSRKNLHKKYMHLTNFSVNKRSANFVANQDATGGLASTSASASGERAQEDEGGGSSKWSLRAFRKWLQASQGPERCAEVWAAVTDIFIKTLLSVETNVSSNMVRLGCHAAQGYELYGFDILLDAQLKPWLMEVNCAPSLSSSSPLDKRIKNELLTDTMHTIGIKPAFVKDKAAEARAAAAEEEAHKARRKAQKMEKSKDGATAAAGTPQQQRAQSAEVTRGGTMGPSNSKSSRSAASSSSSSSSAAASSSSAAASSSDSSGGGGGGRIAKLKSTRPDVYFNALCRSDLSLLREYRDELRRAESGSFRAIFPLGVRDELQVQLADPEAYAPAPAAASLDLYGPLFEFEKYDSLLLMKFVKHFAPEAQEKICRGEKVEPWEVLHAEGSYAATGSTTAAAGGSRERTVPASPSSSASGHNAASFPRRSAGPTSPKPVRPPSGSASSSSIATAAAAMALAHPTLVAAVADYPPASRVDSASMAGRRLTNSSFLAAPPPPPPPAAVSGSGFASDSEEESAAARLGGLQLLDVDAASASPLSSSPEDSEVDEWGRPRRRYFFAQGVDLQPYLPNAPQYHEGWSPAKDDARSAATAAGSNLSHTAEGLAAALAAARATQAKNNHHQQHHQQQHQQQQQQQQHGSRVSSASRRAAAAVAASADPYAAAAAPSAASAGGSSSAYGRARAASSSSGARMSTGMIGLGQPAAWSAAAASASAAALPVSHSAHPAGAHYSRPASGAASRSAMQQAQPLRPHPQNRYADDVPIHPAAHTVFAAPRHVMEFQGAPLQASMRSVSASRTAASGSSLSSMRFGSAPRPSAAGGGGGLFGSSASQFYSSSPAAAAGPSSAMLGADGHLYSAGAPRRGSGHARGGASGGRFAAGW